MIKLEKGEKPPYLKEEKVKELTEKFKLNPKYTVWKHTEIIEYLLKSSNFKCAYCECQLQLEDSYMEVEHFKCKSLYPESVIDWDNLLPSCKRCNNKKSSLNVVTTPIINPYEEDPKLYLSIENYYLYAKGGEDSKGQRTIDYLDLNDERLVLAIFNVCKNINRDMIKLARNIDDIILVRNGMSTTLQLCQPDKAFSAFLSFTLLHNQDTEIIKQLLIDNNLWDDDLSEMYKTCKKIALDPR
ncbi:hypothetical protein A9G11_02345 [Gilliamella sp. wkB108]|uniref:HNH endonuclease n=1 Tax=Gilliamella sp. wkB108 TaxID=3120256 RepID=UPI00080E4EFC|nr:HNH endonuclease [Gilliamella apicola]OCG25484.1 hypothetical protein A9G11_02345 [Gilliamella apicola]